MRKRTGSGGASGPPAATREARTAALRLGWNDAAWGRPRRETDDLLALWYDKGYVGGLAFRGKQTPELVYVLLETHGPMMPNEEVRVTRSSA